METMGQVSDCNRHLENKNGVAWQRIYLSRRVIILKCLQRVIFVRRGLVYSSGIKMPKSWK